MEYMIRKLNNKYYVFGFDQYGNTYDTMRHYDTRRRANLFIKKLKIEDKLGFVSNCDSLYKELDKINSELMS
jgi:hypothetical protein